MADPSLLLGEFIPFPYREFGVFIRVYIWGEGVKEGSCEDFAGHRPGSGVLEFMSFLYLIREFVNG